ncbi:MAG: hypothetical protein K2Q12_05300, partial [Rickettsiales bacterium]|nr:hypothetical protein [Rickettsiales bacterium]
VLAPFDMSEGCMHIVSWGFDTMVWIGAQAAALPGALLPIAPLAGWGAALMAVGGVIFLLPQRRLKIAAMMAVIAGLATALLYQPPDMLISGDGKAIAMRQGEQWSILRGTPRNFAIKEWQLALNVTMQPGIVDRCDRSGCVQPIGSHLFAMPRYERAVAEDCLMADIVVSEKSYSAPCRAALLDGEALRRNGSHALRFSGKQVIIEHGCSQVAARPWNRCQTLKSAK